jgi:hypothetical protein
MPAVELVAAGFLVAMVSLGPILHWAVLFRTTLGLHGGDFLGPPKRRLLWAAPFVLLFHPVPFFVVGACVVTVLAALGRLSSGWLWFLAGFYTYALLMGLLVLASLRKARRRMRGARNA